MTEFLELLKVLSHMGMILAQLMFLVCGIYRCYKNENDSIGWIWLVLALMPVK